MNRDTLSTGVSIVLHRAGRFAICKRLAAGAYEGLWNFPGGRVEPGEGVLQVALRELREETGLAVDASRLVPLGSEVIRKPDGESYVGCRYGLDLAEREEPRQTEPDRHSPWIWVDADGLERADLIPCTKPYAFRFSARQLLATADRHLRRLSSVDGILRDIVGCDCAQPLPRGVLERIEKYRGSA